MFKAFHMEGCHIALVETLRSKNKITETKIAQVEPQFADLSKKNKTFARFHIIPIYAEVCVCVCV